MNRLFPSLYIGFLLFFTSSISYAQTDVSFDFDDCSISEFNGLLPDVEIGGSPDCVCGLTANSLLLDGRDTLKFPSEFTPYFSQEFFTFDFYFTIENTTGDIDIFSQIGDCTKVDSSMYLKYFSGTNDLFFVMGSNISNLITIRSQLDRSICWHRFTLVKSRVEYFVYFDNVLVRRFPARELIPLTLINPLSFSGNPCRLENETGLIGKIENVRWYNRAFSGLEILQNYLYPDQIINRDTTVFEGSPVTLNLGATCGQSIAWSPLTTLDISNNLMTVATPKESTTYQVVVNNGNCVVTDTVRIFVADRESLDCEKLLLPKAFTPNNDGLNDTYGISNTFIIESLDFFEVYDRTGARIWVTSDVNGQWDGTFNGQKVNPGTFMYKVKYNCRNEVRTAIGSFYVLR